jgi:hypothetical protein
MRLKYTCGKLAKISGKEKNISSREVYIYSF